MESVIVGASFPVSNSNDWGNMNTHVIGNKITLNLHPAGASGNVEVSVMFLVNGKQTYNNQNVTSAGISLTPPAGTSYMEFGIQSAATVADYLRIDVWQSSQDWGM